MKHHRVGSRKCPQCGHDYNCVAGGIRDFEREPRARDLCVCGYCRAILVFDEKLNLRLMTDIEEAALSTEERSQVARVRLGTVMAFGPLKPQ